MKGVILAGGHGTRLRPLTHTGPKQLIPIANKPNILYCLEDLRDAGIKDIAVILGNNMPEQVRALLGDGSAWGVRITYIHQGDPRGIAQAVGLTKDFVGQDSFCVYLGDNILKGGIRGLVHEFEKERAECAIALCKVEEPQRYGVALLDAKGRVTKAVEKPREPISDLAIIGIYLFRPSVFDVIATLKPSWRNELEITDAISGLIARGHAVQSHVITGWWKDTGKPEDVLAANHLVLDELEPRNDGTLEPGASLQGRVQVGKGTVIHARSVVRGPAILGEDCVIGPGTHIGPYTAIGPRCQLLGADVEDSIVLEGCRIEASRKIVGSLIGGHTYIGRAEGELPAGVRLILGEHTSVRI
jgi:glucose-1-phosphate thymidylyltransferase